MKVITTILFFLLLQTPRSQFIEGKKYKGYIFNEEVEMLEPISNIGRRIPLEQVDIIRLEELLSQRLNDHINAVKPWNENDASIISNKTHKYLRQYFGYESLDGDTIVWVNMLWEDQVEKEYVSEDVYMVFDGGGYFWNIKVNLTQSELFDLNVNGDG